MNLSTSINLGDTGPVWHVGYEASDGSWTNLSDSGWECKIKVIGGPAERTVVAKTADNQFFVVALSSAETSALAVGGFYDVRVQISNATLNPALSKEISFPVYILSGGVA